jgi:hypothetical protein
MDTIHLLSSNLHEFLDGVSPLYSVSTISPLISYGDEEIGRTRPEDIVGLDIPSRMLVFG